MRGGIVFKLFVSTTALGLFILGSIFASQTLFFQDFYIAKKVETIEKNLQKYKGNYLKYKHSPEIIENLEEAFYEENNTGISTLDQFGWPAHANEFSLTVRLDRVYEESFPHNKEIIIPLYSFISIDDLSINNPFLREGESLQIQAIEKDSMLIPYRISLQDNKITFENTQLSNKEHEFFREGRLDEFPSVLVSGEIVEVNLSDQKSMQRPLYTNDVFRQQIEAFQADLLLETDMNNRTSLTLKEYEENNIPYIVLIDRAIDSKGEDLYFFVLLSLQPVDEAIAMLQEYFLYLFFFLIIITVIVSFYYSRIISRPLIRLNSITKEIIKLDFSQKIPISSNDEIGELSQNINLLSETLHSYIKNLEEDLEQEKKLEKTRKEFISGVSHELKTPLTVINSCVSILKDDIATHKKDYYFKAIEDEVAKMNTLIVDMLELAKLESGVMQLEVGLFYINHLIEDVCEKLEIEMQKKNLHVCKKLLEVNVLANKSFIEQVITNFMMNAIRYTPENENIIISLKKKDNRIKVAIENHGVHLTEEHMSKIWDRFYKVDRSRQRTTGGTGLGLTLCKNILELHQVEYSVKNTEKGVLFFFYLNEA